MKLAFLLGVAPFAIAAFAGTQACSSTSDATSTVHCTPGNYVFCRCADRSSGTKLCKDDGASFEACSTDDSGECAGGEDLTDPQTGTPVNPPDNADAGGDSSTGTNAAALDSCPGAPTAIGSAQLTIKGDTTGAKDKAKGKTGACAVGGGGGDHVYHLQPTATGSLAIKVQALAELNPTVYLRSACDDELSQLACAETTGAGGAEQFQYNVINGHDYYLYVDAASGTAGEYALDLKLTPGSFCGDGKVDANEACDDMNKVDGDGCSPSCLAVNGDPPSGGSCAGHPVHMWPGKVVTGTGSTTGPTATPYPNTFTKTGTSCLVSANDLNISTDHIYAVTAHGAGSLKVTVTPEASFNAELVARTTCADPNTQGTNMCANDFSTGAAETMTFPVQNNQTVYVAVDGALGSKGTYTVKFEL